MSGDGTSERHTELTFTGPATFFKAPYVPGLQADDGEANAAELPAEFVYDAAFLGVPHDFAVGFRPGARFAPAAVRTASGRYALPPQGFYDFATHSYRLAGARLADAGDVNLAQTEAQLNADRITAAAKAVRRAVRLPLFVGGDHFVSYPLLRAFHDVDDLHVVQLDAHLDFTDSRNDTRFANSSPFRRAVEEMPNLTHITVVGLRGVRADAGAFRAARERGHTLVSAAEVHASLERVTQALPEGKSVYLSVDVDALDPSELPGTSSPEPEGLSYAQLRDLIGATLGRNRLVGLDVTELAPNLDASGRSELLTARLLAETLALWWDEPG